MKHAFSRFSAFLNHLLANVLSTFVEKWLQRYVTGVVIVSSEKVLLKRNYGSKVIAIDEESGKLYIVDAA